MDDNLLVEQGLIEQRIRVRLGALAPLADCMVAYLRTTNTSTPAYRDMSSEDRQMITEAIQAMAFGQNPGDLTKLQAYGVARFEIEKFWAEDAMGTVI